MEPDDLLWSWTRTIHAWRQLGIIQQLMLSIWKEEGQTALLSSLLIFIFHFESQNLRARRGLRGHLVVPYPKPRNPNGHLVATGAFPMQSSVFCGWEIVTHLCEINSANVLKIPSASQNKQIPYMVFLLSLPTSPAVDRRHRSVMALFSADAGCGFRILNRMLQKVTTDQLMLAREIN